MATTSRIILDYMTTLPHSIGAGKTLEHAKALMQDQGIRHLPVTRDGTVVGILSDRDVKLAYGIEGIEPDTLLVIDVCHQNPYIVEPETSLQEVATVMAEQHYGSALVMRDGSLVGIFTTVDACRALASIID